jgi:hypothetical protein
VVTTTTVIEYKFKDGSVVTETQESTAKRGHHTAIVNGMADGVLPKVLLRRGA